MKSGFLVPTVFLLFAGQIVFGQNTIPTIGQRMPAFQLSNVEYYSKKQVSAEDFKGKWLFLDFWYRGCTSCIKSFPKTNLLQENFKDKIQFLLVGLNSERAFGKGIKPLFEKLREKMQLHLPIAYDSVLASQWDIPNYPHIIIVNPEGIVHSITAGYDLTMEKVSDLVSGKVVAFEQKNIERPFFEGKSISSSDSNVLIRSVLTPWNGESQHVGEVWYQQRVGSVRIYKEAMAHLTWLYKIAYFGTPSWLHSSSLYSSVYPFLILEIKDSSLFEYDFRKGIGLYNYEVSIKSITDADQKIMQALQKDLQLGFGFSGTIETRRMPVWKLIAKPGAEAKLRTKGKAPGYINDVTGDGGAGGFAFNNYPVSGLLELLIFHLSPNGLPFFDATGITGNIDIKIDALMSDWAQVRKELQRNELDLVKGEREMKVLVIRDHKD